MYGTAGFPSNAAHATHARKLVRNTRNERNGRQRRLCSTTAQHSPQQTNVSFQWTCH